MRAGGAIGGFVRAKARATVLTVADRVRCTVHQDGGVRVGGPHLPGCGGLLCLATAVVRGAMLTLLGTNDGNAGMCHVLQLHTNK